MIKRLRQFLFAMLLTAVCFQVQADGGKYRILVNRFGRNGNSAVSSSSQADVQRLVIRLIAEPRFVIFDGSKMGSDTGGIDYIVEGNFSQLRYATKRYDSSTSYIAMGTLSLSLIRASDKNIVATTVITENASDSDSNQEAYVGLVRTLARKAAETILSKFVERGEIDDISIVEDGEAKELIAGLGSDDGFGKGDKIAVVFQRTVRGRTYYRKIGEVKVEETIGSDKVRCKVTDGHREIYRIYLETPEKLFLQTKTK